MLNQENVLKFKEYLSSFKGNEYFSISYRTSFSRLQASFSLIMLTNNFCIGLIRILFLVHLNQLIFIQECLFRFF